MKEPTEVRRSSYIVTYVTTSHLHTTQIKSSERLVIEEWNGPIIFSAVHCPPWHPVSEIEFYNFFRSFGNRFVEGSDFNAKRPNWSSMLTNRKCRSLNKVLQTNYYYATPQQLTGLRTVRKFLISWISLLPKKYW